MEAEASRCNLKELARHAFEAFRRFDDAFDHLADGYRSRIRRFCLRTLANNGDDAEDASQEVFLRAHKSFSTLRSPEMFERWIYRIAVNCANDVMKKRGRLITNTMGEPGDPFEDLPDPIDAIADLHDRAEWKRAIHAGKAAIEERDELDRSICDLLYVRGIQNIAEISRILGKPENTIRTRAKRIREDLEELGSKLRCAG